MPERFLAMRDELVDLEFAVLIIGNKLAHLRAALHTTEGTAFPYATGD